MPRDARDNGISRRSWLLACLAFPLFGARAADALSVNYDGDNLHPVDPGLHFLTQKTAALDRLKDADAVTFVYWLQLFTIDRSVPRAESRGKFVVSYDIFEERFQVNFGGRSQSGLTAVDAEKLCLERMAVSAAGIPQDLPFFLRLELRTAGPRELPSVTTDSGISLRAFVEIFSRKPGADDPHWGPLESPRLRLSDLGRTPGRGARNG